MLQSRDSLKYFGESLDARRKRYTVDWMKPFELLSALGSAFAAMFGVQSRAKHETDFGSKRFLPYLIAAVIATACLILAILLAVRLVLAS